MNNYFSEDNNNAVHSNHNLVDRSAIYYDIYMDKQERIIEFVKSFSVNITEAEYNLQDLCRTFSVETLLDSDLYKIINKQFVAMCSSFAGERNSNGKIKNNPKQQQIISSQYIDFCMIGLKTRIMDSLISYFIKNTSNIHDLSNIDINNIWVQFLDYLLNYGDDIFKNNNHSSDFKAIFKLVQIKEKIDKLDYKNNNYERNENLRLLNEKKIKQQLNEERNGYIKQYVNKLLKLIIKFVNITTREQLNRWNNDRLRSESNKDTMDQLYIFFKLFSEKIKDERIHEINTIIPEMKTEITEVGKEYKRDVMNLVNQIKLASDRKNNEQKTKLQKIRKLIDRDFNKYISGLEKKISYLEHEKRSYGVYSMIGTDRNKLITELNTSDNSLIKKISKKYLKEMIDYILRRPEKSISWDEFKNIFKSTALKDPALRIYIAKRPHAKSSFINRGKVGSAKRKKIIKKTLKKVKK